MADFAKRLKELRIAKGMTQEELAEALGSARSTIGGYEAPSKEREPDFDFVKKAAEFFGVTTDYLLGKDTSFSWIESLSPELRELLSNPNNKDIVDVLTQLAKDGKSSDEIRRNLKIALVLKNAVRELSE